MKIIRKITIVIFLFLILPTPSFVYAEKSKGIPLHHSLGELAIDPYTNTIYAATTGSGPGYEGIFVIDGQTNQIKEQLGLEGKLIFSLAVNSITNNLYVGYSKSQLKENPAPVGSPYSDRYESTNAINVIDRSSNKIIKTILTKDDPNDIEINTNTNQIFVSSMYAKLVSVIDGKNNEGIKNIKVDYAIQDIEVNEQTNEIYVSTKSFGSDRKDLLFVIDGDSLQARYDKKHISTDKDFRSVVVNPETNMVYLANGRTNSISVIDSTTFLVVDEIDVGDFPVKIAINPITNFIYVLNFNSASISVIDGKLNEVITTIEIGKFHHTDLDLNPITGLAYVILGQEIHVINGTNNKIMPIETDEREPSAPELILFFIFALIAQTFGLYSATPEINSIINPGGENLFNEQEPSRKLLELPNEFVKFT